MNEDTLRSARLKKTRAVVRREQGEVERRHEPVGFQEVISVTIGATILCALSLSEGVSR